MAGLVSLKSPLTGSIVNTSTRFIVATVSTVLEDLTPQRITVLVETSAVSQEVVDALG